MKILLVTFGSRGDVQPVLALALAIQDRGHEVLLVGPPERATWAQEYGCPYRPLGGNLTAFIDGIPQAHTLTAALRFVAFVYREVREQFERLHEILEGADLVIGASLVFALSSVAEQMGVPYRYLAFCPQILPSAYHPFPAFKTQRFPSGLNRLTWKGMHTLDRIGLSRLVNNWRKQAGLMALQDPWSHFVGDKVIVASDPELAGLPPDLETRADQTGYLHLRQSRPSNPVLEKFFESGLPPVFAGFGSMPKKDQARNVSLMVKAARLNGQRIIINKFWDEPSEYSGEKDVFFLKGYPHLELFPKVSMVIHHGGAGTTASSAISGVPQIIVPHILDQYYWGERIYRARLGPKPIRRSRLSARNLGQAIQECLSDNRMRLKAGEISCRIRDRDSLGLTVDALSL
ncbi:MAG: glycosyltransferase [Thermodesulfobacteriota bacterium]